VPGFVIGYCLIYIFAIELGWLPVQGYVRIGVNFGSSRAHDPALAHPVGRLHRADRPHHPRLGAEVLNEDYIRTARAKGSPTGSC
jgi:peptide/nickel transport system permease protein